MNDFRGFIHANNIPRIPLELWLIIVNATLCAHNECWDISAVINLLMTCKEYKMDVLNMLKGFDWKQHFLIRNDYLKLKKLISLNESDAKIAGIILVDGTVMEFSWENVENNKENIKHVCIPSSVTSIGTAAFWGCCSLISITIPNSVTLIGDGAFWGCHSLTSIIIPYSVTLIGEGVFEGCKSLSSIKIPDSVTLIGASAFAWCRSLTSITIPDSVTLIGDAAFYGCSSLTSIIIPSSVTSIGKRAFADCRSLISYNP